jgi:alkylation response protein AidB-like acyl-CoA dehydrogenase
MNDVGRSRRPFMDFSLTDEESMLVAAAVDFAKRALRPNEREHERSGVGEATRLAFAECGFDLLAGAEEDDAELPVSWPARIRVIEVLAAGDVASTLALWTPEAARLAARTVGAPDADVGAVHLVHALHDTPPPLPCLPLGGARTLLVLDSAGWGLATLEVEPVRGLGLHAAGPSRAVATWSDRGRVLPAVAAVAIARVRLVAAALLVGVARASLEYVRGYLPERVAFGKKLSDHQGLAFLFAEMAMQVEGASVLLSRAGWELDEGRPDAAVDAWLEAREAALCVTNRGVQLLGGHGYMADHPVEKWMRDARALALLFGGEDLALADARARP